MRSMSAALGSSMRLLWSLFIALGGYLLPAAEPPQLSLLVPFGGQVGTTLAVEATGKFPEWPVQIWSSDPRVQGVCLADTGKLELRIAADAQPGLGWIRCYTPQGASAVQPFLIGTAPHSSETEPNNNLSEAIRIEKLPATLCGRLDKTADVDLVAVQLEAQQWFSAGIDAVKWLASPADMSLQLLDSRGFVVAENLDHVGLDPYLEYQAPAAGTYFVRAFGFPATPNSTIAFGGGSDWIYRLRLSAKRDPFSTTLDYANQSLVFAERQHLPPGAHTSLEQALGLQLPIFASGVICTPRQTDYVRFAASAGSSYRVRIMARQFGSPLDPALSILDTSGKQLAQQDDLAKQPDPELVWKAPAAGEYVAAISDFHRFGADDFHYWLLVEEVVPSFSISLSTNLISAKTQQETEIAVAINRQSFSNELSIFIEGLPAAITASAEISKSGSDSEKKVTLRLTASEPWQGPISLSVEPVDSSAERKTISADSTGKPLWLSVVGPAAQ